MFTPESATLELESPLGDTSLRIRIRCAEPMDPGDPRPNDDRVTIDIDGIPFSGTSHSDLDGLSVAFPEDDVEASIYHYGYHNPIDLTTLRLHSTFDGGVVAEFAGVIDFTFEGLSRLGKPEINWSVDLDCDFDAFDSKCQAAN